MERKRHIISKTAGRKHCPKDTNNLEFMEQVVYKTPVGKVNGVQKYTSVTRHEIIKK